MRRAQVRMALGLTLGAAVLLRQAVRLPLARPVDAGFFPFWLSAGVGLAAVLLVGRQLLAPARAADAEPFIPVEAWRPLVVVIVPIVAIIALIRWLGIYLGGALYLAGYMWLVGRFRWTAIIPVSLAIPVALFLIFERWFLLPMPGGIILEYLLYGR
jgi:hypothetical protein